MPRDLFSSVNPAAPTADAVAAQPQQVPPHFQAQQQSAAQERDALAGALPEWDLLPASPFVRRVK